MTRLLTACWIIRLGCVIAVSIVGIASTPEDGVWKLCVGDASILYSHISSSSLGRFQLLGKARFSLSAL